MKADISTTATQITYHKINNNSGLSLSQMLDIIFRSQTIQWFPEIDRIIWHWFKTNHMLTSVHTTVVIQERQLHNPTSNCSSIQFLDNSICGISKITKPKKTHRINHIKNEANVPVLISHPLEVVYKHKCQFLLMTFKSNE